MEIEAPCFFHDFTLTSVAKRNHVSATTVANTFDAHVQLSRKPLPRFLSIDEVYAFRSDKSKYVCVLLDYQNRTSVDFLPSRKKEDLHRFFDSIPRSELENVKVFSSGMWDTYRSVAAYYFPHCAYIVDHLCKALHK